MKILFSFGLMVGAQYGLYWETQNFWLSGGIPAAIFLAYWGRQVILEWRALGRED